jgi:hypothetical protein
MAKASKTKALPVVNKNLLAVQTALIFAQQQMAG